MSINYNKRPGEKADTKQHEDEKMTDLNEVYDHSSTMANDERAASTKETTSAMSASDEAKGQSTTPSSTNPVSGAGSRQFGDEASQSEVENVVDHTMGDDHDADAEHETYHDPKIIQFPGRGIQPSGVMSESSDHPGADVNYESTAEDAAQPVLNKRGKASAKRTQDTLDKTIVDGQTKHFNEHNKRIRAEYQMRDWLVDNYYQSIIKRHQKSAKDQKFGLTQARKLAWEDVDKYEDAHNLLQEGQVDGKGNPQIKAMQDVVLPNLAVIHKERVAEWKASEDAKKQGADNAQDKDNEKENNQPDLDDHSDDRNLTPADKLKRSQQWARQAAMANTDQEHNLYSYRATQLFLDAKFPGQHDQAEHFENMMLSQSRAGQPGATNSEKMLAFAGKLNVHFDEMNAQADQYIKTMAGDPADQMSKEDAEIQQKLFGMHEDADEAAVNDDEVDTADSANESMLSNKKKQQRYRNDQRSEQDDDQKNGHEETRQDIKRWQKLMSKDHGAIKADPYHEYKGKLRVYLPRDLDMVAYGETMRRLGQKPDANDLKFDQKKDQPYAMMDPNQYYTYAQVQREQQNQIDQQRIEQAQKLDEKNQEKARQATDPNSKMFKDKRQAMLESLPTSALVFELGRRAGHGMVASTASDVGKIAQGLQMWAQRAAMSMRKHDSAVSPAVSIIGDGTFNREQQKYAGPER